MFAAWIWIEGLGHQREYILLVGETLLFVHGFMDGSVGGIMRPRAVIVATKRGRSVRLPRWCNSERLMQTAELVVGDPKFHASRYYGVKGGIARIMNSSKSGTVNAMSPCAGL